MLQTYQHLIMITVCHTWEVEGPLVCSGYKKYTNGAGRWKEDGSWWDPRSTGKHTISSQTQLLR